MLLQPTLEKHSTLLKISDLSVFYGKVEAIKSISIEVKEGEIVAVIGSNGAGKSTLLRAVSGHETPTRGEIWLGDMRIDSRRPQEIARIGIAHILEGRKVFPQMTTLENLRLGAFLREEKETLQDDLARVFEHFPPLKDRQRQQAGNLSGGEQQMVALGRALMGRPRLLLLDEPSLGLSPIMAREMIRVITKINHEGVSIMLVDQNARLSLSNSHKGYVLEMGEIVLQGDPAILLDNEDVKRAYLGV